MLYKKNSTVPHFSLEIEGQTPERANGKLREGIRAQQARSRRVMLRLSYNVSNVKNKEILHVCLLVCDVIPISKASYTEQN